MQIILGVLIPFLGTILGASMVFFIKNNICSFLEKFLLGFASGIMIAASIWSLIIPAIELSKDSGIIHYIPVMVGFVGGFIFLIIINFFIEKISYFNKRKKFNKLKKTIMMILVVTFHNIPEGMAVGIVFSGVLARTELISLAGAFAFCIGIAIQNFPEGAIISMPLRSMGTSKIKSFYYGVLSGIVEPIGAIITIMLFSVVVNVLPFLLTFAAGAMIYVVILELIPDIFNGGSYRYGILGTVLGFIIMMTLDIFC